MFIDIYLLKLILVNDNLLATILSKLIKLSQNNAAKLDAVLESQEKMKAMLNEQQNQISVILSKIGSQPEVVKGKGKGKANDNFYQVYTIFLRHFLMLFYL